LFHTAKGIRIPGVTVETIERVRRTQAERFDISPLQTAEGAAYSLAMVVRHALGTFAKDGSVITLVGPGLAGAVAAATSRHLLSAGARVTVLPSVMEDSLPKAVANQLSILTRMGASMLPFSSIPALQPLLAGAHILIWGAYSAEVKSSPVIAGIIELLNESSVPVHTLEAPPGINENSGERSGPLLYASSTLSLGLVLAGLDAAREYVGRHYLCDTSIPHTLYSEQGVQPGEIFSEQPVLQIFPGEPE